MTGGGDASCPNCGAPHERDDIFCESCGYEFLTGSLPSAAEAEALGLACAVNRSPGSDTMPAPPDSPASGSLSPPRVQVDVMADRTYFDTVVSEGELAYPDPAPGPRQLVLTGSEIHIGRTSESRAIHPDVDVAALTGDPAVSSRHAVVRLGADGTMTVTDVGSTNGTIVGPVDGDALTVGHERAIDTGTPIYVGAWTRLILSVIP